MVAAGRASSWLSSVAKAAAFAIAVVLLSGLTLKTLYSTQLGFVVADAIPDAVWRALEGAHGPADGESAENVGAFALAAVSVVVALAVVGACALLVRRLRR
jgi:hypothetical protein